MNQTNHSQVRETLKRNRENKGLSLKTVHQDTRISLRYLEALESGEWNQIPAEVYVIGFLRNYAAYLGLNPESIVAQYRNEQDSAVTAQPEKKATSPEFSSHPDGKRFGLIILGFSLLVAVGGWWMRKEIKEESPASPSAPHSYSSSIPLEKLVSESLRLQIKALDLAWLRVSADGKLLFEGFLSSGTAQSWGTQTDFSVRIGNVNAVQILLNEKPIDPTLGAIKGVNDLHLTSQDLAVSKPHEPRQ
ncbi:MAG: helix-turn-helix domain-containing protein [Elusimicrobia bacterium]|nr:helix-turn-helix domain-containing protein [Elusimicrobiota bacterium]MBI4217681.1 helix-turn-helix domain-containing protein [Elusimicrobiota bacterium]